MRIHMKTLLQLVTLSCLSLPAFAQTPFALAPNMLPICNEGCTITAISSPTAVLQFGAGTTWGPAFTMKTFPQPIQMFDPANMTLSPFDPKPRSLKGIDAQQQATAYTVRWTQNGTTTVTTVPALKPAPVPATPTIVATYTGCTINLMSDGSFSSVAGTCKAVTK
jgi:hypothetical protein